jgi:hypothetical protein
MNKKEVLKIIREDLGCGNEEAEDIFQREVESGKLKWHSTTIRVNWRRLFLYVISLLKTLVIKLIVNSRTMYLSVLVLLIWLISIYI